MVDGLLCLYVESYEVDAPMYRWTINLTVFILEPESVSKMWKVRVLT
jgi:hypothetical protein